MSLGTDLDEIDPCRGQQCICFLFHIYIFFGHKKRNIFLILWPSFVVSIFILLFLQINVNMNIPARNTEQHEDYAWLASGSSRTDFPLSVVAWEIPSSSQVSARCRFRQSHREQKDWIFRRRIEDCWGTQGSPLLWFLGRWRWMLFPSPAFLPLGKDTWGLPSSWKRCKTYEIENKTMSTKDYEELFFHNEYKSRTWLAYYLIRRLPAGWLADCLTDNCQTDWLIY